MGALIAERQDLQRIEAIRGNWLDRAIGYVAPQVALRRIRARAAAEVMLRHYEAASQGRRTQGWKRGSGDANSVQGPALSTLREVARDLVRNNGHAESALETICDHVVGWGIYAKAAKKNKRAMDLWKAWAESTDCDSDGRNDFYGLQHLAMRTVVESGEVLVRRRFRRPEDGLAIPMQIQVLDPDYIDTLKVGSFDVRNGEGKVVGQNRIIHGVEFDIIGRRVAYWLFRDHPGSVLAMTSAQSYRVPAESVLHIYRQQRPGQVRAASWFAPVLLKFKDFDEFDDATLMKQKIAACLAVITSDVDGSATGLGTTNADQSPEWDSLEPGMIVNAAPGRQITVVQPPTVREYPQYCATTLRAIAAGLGVSYEDLTGDYSQVNFSSARMSRLRHWARVEGWRWRMLIPQMCAPVWRWAMEAAAVMGAKSDGLKAEWTAPPLPFVDPDKEGLAYMRLIRAGIMSRSEALRERGSDPDLVMEEIAADNELADKLGIILDSDPRNTTQAGNPRSAQANEKPETDEPAVPANPTDKDPTADEQEETE